MRQGDPGAWLRQNNIPLTADDAPIKETIEVLAKTQRYADIKTRPPARGADCDRRRDAWRFDRGARAQVVPRIPYGTTGRRPGRGLKQRRRRPAAPEVTLLDLKRNVGKFEKGVEVPLGPFMGVMGVLPPESEGPNRRSGPPGVYSPAISISRSSTTGSTLYIPVFHKGAMFFTGDAHAVQGDGEITGTAIETANTVILKFLLHKGKTLKAPRAETATHYITIGLDPDLDNAMQMASDETVELLEEIKGWTCSRAAAREHRRRLSHHADRRRHEGRARNDSEEATSSIAKTSTGTSPEPYRAADPSLHPHDDNGASRAAIATASRLFRTTPPALGATYRTAEGRQTRNRRAARVSGASKSRANFVAPHVFGRA